VYVHASLCHGQWDIIDDDFAPGVVWFEIRGHRFGCNVEGSLDGWPQRSMVDRQLLGRVGESRVEDELPIGRKAPEHPLTSRSNAPAADKVSGVLSDSAALTALNSDRLACAEDRCCPDEHFGMAPRRLTFRTNSTLITPAKRYSPCH